MRHLTRIFTVLLIVLMVTSTCLSFAETVTMIDQFTGYEINEDVTQNENVAIGSNCRYIRTDNRYVFTTSSIADSQIASTVYDGMITTDSVSIEAGKQCSMEIYRNGEPIDVGPGSLIISNAGSYKVFADGKSIFSFTVIGNTTGIVSSYPMPQGFEITNVTLDGESYPHSLDNVTFEKEGRYVVSYKCVKTGMFYSLATLYDNTPPEITLIGVENGIAKSAVTIEGLQEGDTITCFVNGVQINASTTLKQSGSYELVVTDKAGNASNYTFRIKLYFNLSAWVAIALIVIILLVTCGYIIYSRKHLKIC